MTKTIFTYREHIYVALLLLVLMSFMVSYALNSISTVLLGVFFFIDRTKNIRTKLRVFKESRIVVFYVLFFIGQCIGLIYTENIAYGIQKATLFLPLIFLPAVLLSERLNLKYFGYALEILKYWTAIVFLYLLITHLYVDERPLSNFVNHTINARLGISQFYLVYLILVPVLYCFFQIEKSHRVIVNGFFLVLFIFFIVLMANRFSFIMLIGVLLLKGKNIMSSMSSTMWKWSFLPLFVSLAILLVVYSPGLRKKVDVFVKTTDFDIETVITKNKVTYTKNTFEHRFLINYLSLSIIKDNLLFGVGTGDYQDMLEKSYDEIHFKSGMGLKLNNHNQYLTEFLKTGILGGLCFIYLLFLLAREASLSNKYFVYFVGFFIVGSLLESYLSRQHGIVVFSFFLPLFLKFEMEIKKTTSTV